MNTKTINKALSSPALQQQAIPVVRRHIDIPLGFALLKDRRVPISKKLLALLVGVVGTALLLAIEIPLELLAAILAVPLGVVDGLEVILLPVALACASLPRISPVALVDQVRAERAVRA